MSDAKKPIEPSLTSEDVPDELIEGAPVAEEGDQKVVEKQVRPKKEITEILEPVSEKLEPEEELEFDLSEFDMGDMVIDLEADDLQLESAPQLEAPPHDFCPAKRTPAADTPPKEPHAKMVKVVEEAVKQGQLDVTKERPKQLQGYMMIISIR